MNWKYISDQLYAVGVPHEHVDEMEIQIDVEGKMVKINTFRLEMRDERAIVLKPGKPRVRKAKATDNRAAIAADAEKTAKKLAGGSDGGTN